MWKRGKFWKRVVLLLLIAPIVLFSFITLVLYWKQDAIVQSVLESANTDFYGKVEIEESHIAPFANFPYISIDLEHLRVFDSKEGKESPVVDIGHVYIGFDLFTLIGGNFDVKSLKLSNGIVDVFAYENGELNIERAFKTDKPSEEIEEDFHFALKKLKIENVDIAKTNAQGLKLDSYFHKAEIGFSTKEEHLFFSLDGNFDLSIIENGDTSFIHDKHFDVDAELDYYKKTEILDIQRGILNISGAQFDLEGEIDIFNDLDLDLKMSGKKPDFSLFIALAPDDLIPVLELFENRGDVFFSATATGKSANGKIPKIHAEFGCDNGFFKNPKTNKTLDDLFFRGAFTTGEEPSLENMRFTMSDFSAKPETGKFDINLSLENFVSPDIQLQLTTLFDLDYLAQFLNLESLEELKGMVELKMNFHDIIDLENPEKSIEKLNESYYTELNVENLSFIIPGYNQRIDDIDVELKMDGHKADLRELFIRVGNTDLSISGSIDDLPAVIHHTALPVVTDLHIKSKVINLNLLTSAKGDKVVNEKIKNLKLDLKFESSARAITESPYLPVGDFFVENLFADFTHYPHSLHDFHADIYIDTADISVVDFTGMIDDSDFHFSGGVNKYPLFFQEKLEGDTELEFDLTSDEFHLADVLSFGGENSIPEDYREEEFKGLKLHGKTQIHFRQEHFQSIDMQLTEFTGKMKIHPMKLERFSGNVHFEDDHLTVNKFKGIIGKSDLLMDLDLFFGELKQKQKKQNQLVFVSRNLDFDQLLSYETTAAEPPENHDSVFSVFDIPFPDMKYDVKIAKINYHRYLSSNINAVIRTTKEHYLYMDTLQMDIAGGHMDIGGYFNGSDRNNIYFSPTIGMKNINLDKLMFKFENFGQDQLVSENLHGRISGKLWGKIHMHADLVPIIDDSEIHMDVEVTGGSVEKYGPLEALSGFFEDEKLHKVIFDTLQNHLDMTDGVMTIPNMVINTNLGFIEISGKQDMEYNMEYYLKVPMKMITSAGSNKLFGKKKEDTSNPEELFEYDPTKKYRYVNIKISGDAEDYKITLGKDKGK
jgi:hypothetical protein